ncbi:hypothetical protein [Parasphingorhabdus sp.]|uniref:hypothetical protein n=1 Tax=Parasphingorhabdus sp. TaxID=2709688 RepID=UPI003A8EB614
MQWFEIKIWLESSIGLDRDSLHIYAGVGIQLAVALFCRRSLASPIPWLVVVAAAFANEFYDYTHLGETFEKYSKYYHEEAIRDIWNTLLLPTLFLLIAKFWPTWLTGKHPADKEMDKPAETSPPI